MKISGVMNSGLVRCWHIVLVYFRNQDNSVVGVSAARCVYLRAGSSLGWLWSLCADMIRSAMSSWSFCASAWSLLSGRSLSMMPLCLFERVSIWWL